MSRVQVTTLTSSLSADAKLCSLDPTVLDDDSICGDTFISGFLKGGEFSSIVSVKVHDKNRIGKVRAQLEMYIRSLQTITPPLAELDAAGETEISISVQWRGGQVDFPDCEWH